MSTSGDASQTTPEKILSSRAALEEERKQVTVFFAAVKGSTSEPALLLERHP